MEKSKKIIIGLIAIILILIGGIGGYITEHYLNSGKATSTFTQSNNSDTNKQKEVKLTANRDTAVVEAVKKVGPSVVGITTKVYEKDIFQRNVLVGEGVGSGVIIDAAGYIVTNNHVVADAENGKVVVSLPDGSTVDGKVVGTDALSDLAVVKISTDKKLNVAELGDSDAIQVGEPAIAIGNPLGLEFQGSVTTGVISALHRSIDSADQILPLIQTDAAINPGNSGGALINADGQLIGINSSKIAKTGVEGMGFAIPINEARPIIDDLIKNGKVSRPYLGIYALDKESAAQYGYELSKEGLYIVKLAKNGPAAEAGLRPKDLITAVADTKVTSLHDLRNVLNKYKVGDSISVTYERNGKQDSVNVTLIDTPQESQQ